VEHLIEKKNFFVQFIANEKLNFILQKDIEKHFKSFQQFFFISFDPEISNGSKGYKHYVLCA